MFIIIYETLYYDREILTVIIITNTCQTNFSCNNLSIFWYYQVQLITFQYKQR